MNSAPAGSAPASNSNAGLLYLYRELWHQTVGHRVRLLGAMTLLISAQLVLLLIPMFMGRALNALQAHGLAHLWDAGRWLLLVVAITAGSWILHGPGRLLERNVALAVRRRVSTALTEQLLTLPLSWHEGNHSAATAHRVQQSSNALSSFAQSQFIYLNSAVRLVGPVIALWCMEPKVGMAAIVGFCAVCLSVVGFDRAMIRLARRENDAERRYAATLVDSLSNSTSLFALRQARAVVALLKLRLESIFEPLRRSIVLNEAKWCTVDISTRALSCLLVGTFAWLTARGSGAGAGAQTLMIGSIYMVWEYANQASSVISSVASHFQTFARQHADYASADPIREAAAAPATSNSTALTPGAWQRCEIRELTFHHAAARSGAPALDHVTLSLERGKKYALVGGSGSGKSTLLRALSGLYHADRIVVDPKSQPAIFAPAEAARYLRGTTTLIPQDAEVIEGTLAENLALCESIDGAPDASHYQRSLDLMHVSEFMGDGDAALNTSIAERAANLSGGQRARIALARGVLAAKGSTLVLLDEPTASLDPRTESRVYDNLFDHFKDACVVSSIHKLGLLDRFDEVLVMHAGRLVAQGPASILLATSPDFRQLMASHVKEAVAA